MYLPKHIAIIMDGNGRWARQRHLPRVAGHKQGLESARRVVQACVERKIEILTLFAFSTENWRRPVQEVNALMDIFLKGLQKEVNKLHENNVQLQFIGEHTALDLELQRCMREAVELTKTNTGLKLVIAVNYGGRWDIVQAAKTLAQAVQSGTLMPEDITEDHLTQQLSTASLPEPDLFIRASGEQRISNFLNWQLSYTELFFTETLWPDFDEKSVDDAIAYFSQRQRRFGFTGQQVEKQCQTLQDAS